MAHNQLSRQKGKDNRGLLRAERRGEGPTGGRGRPGRPQGDPVPTRRDTPRCFTLAVFSDIHFGAHNEACLRSCLAWAWDKRPEEVILLGDIVDCARLSQKYDPEETSTTLMEEVKRALEFIASLRALGCRVTIVPGNHEARFNKLVVGRNAPALAGFKSLTLEACFREAGLPTDVRWVSEGPGCPGVLHRASRTLFRHGDKQAKGFGAQNIGAKLVRENPGVSVVVGHHHRAQLHTQTVLDQTYFYVANPHLSGEHSYASSPDWQRGFSYYEFFGADRFGDCPRVTPHLVVMDDQGRFSDGGKVYGQ